MKFANQTFTDQILDLDFNEFSNCKLEKCTLVYHGYGSIGVSGCQIIESKWAFADAAAKTINFMSAMYRDNNEDAKQLIEMTFESIRKGRQQ